VTGPEEVQEQTEDEADVNPQKEPEKDGGNEIKY